MMTDQSEQSKGRAVGYNDLYPLLQFPPCYGKVGLPCHFDGFSGAGKCKLRAACMKKRREQRRKDSAILRLPYYD